jgi:hypothetical protein
VTTFATFDPALPQTTLRFALSGGNLTMTGLNSTSPALGNSFPGLAQANVGIPSGSGKFYVEFTFNGTTANNVGGTGVLPAQGLNQGLGFGDVNGQSGAGYFCANGRLLVEGNLGFTSGNSYGPGNSGGSAGDVIGVAIDAVNETCWFRMNGGQWLGNSGVNSTANPATNTQGIDISATFAIGRVYPGVQFVDGSTNSVTANFGASSFAGTVPSGFTAGLPVMDDFFGSLYTDETGSTGTLNGQGFVNPFVTPGTAGTVDYVIGVVTTAQSSSNRAVIYDDTGSGGSPGNLLGASTILTSIANGENKFTFSTPVAYSAGATIWIGIYNDGTGAYSSNVNPTGSGTTDDLLGGTSGSVASPPSTWTTSGTGTHQVPLLAHFVPGASTETATVDMAFSGIAMHAGEALEETATVALALDGIQIAAAGEVIDETASVGLHLGAIAIIVNAVDVSAEPTLVSFYTF